MTGPDDEDLAREAVEAAEQVDQAALDRATRRARDAVQRRLDGQ